MTCRSPCTCLGCLAHIALTMLHAHTQQHAHIMFSSDVHIPWLNTLDLFLCPCCYQLYDVSPEGAVVIPPHNPTSSPSLPSPPPNNLPSDSVKYALQYVSSYPGLDIHVLLFLHPCCLTFYITIWLTQA